MFDNKSYQENYRTRNREKNRLYAKRYRIENANKISQKRKEKRKFTRDIENARTAKWRKENPGKQNALNAFRKLCKRNATPKWLSKEQFKQIKEFYVLAKELQWLSDTSDPFQVDHIVPINGESVSGLHVPWNLQIIPRSINLEKGNKYE